MKNSRHKHFNADLYVNTGIKFYPTSIVDITAADEHPYTFISRKSSSVLDIFPSGEVPKVHIRKTFTKCPLLFPPIHVYTLTQRRRKYFPYVPERKRETPRGLRLDGTAKVPAPRMYRVSVTLRVSDILRAIRVSPNFLCEQSKESGRFCDVYNVVSSLQFFFFFFLLLGTTSGEMFSSVRFTRATHVFLGRR